MSGLFKSYRKVQPHITNVILAECCLQLINAAFFLVLLIYMKKSGYEDHEGANFTKYRFLSVLLVAVPLGIYISGKRIKPYFYFASIVVPVSSLFILYGVDAHNDLIIYVAQFTWGIGFVCMQMLALPYILRNSSPETITEGISLSHSTWSIAGVVSGLLIFSLQSLLPDYFTERNVLIFISVCGFAAWYFVSKLNIEENLNDPAVKENTKEPYNWNLILKATVPIILIAVGAGLTIPFISLFFYVVHGIDSEHFAIIASFALAIVFAGTLLVPYIKNRMGYKVAVPLTQSLAILALVALALTEHIKGTVMGVTIAVFFYTLRQPLMNMAAPMTSEVTMVYVGKRNQEMMSAITAAIWNGSWFISAYVFEILRKEEFRYMNIFLITAGLYAIGVIAYLFLIRDYERRR